MSHWASGLQGCYEVMVSPVGFQSTKVARWATCSTIMLPWARFHRRAVPSAPTEALYAREPHKHNHQRISVSQLKLQMVGHTYEVLSLGVIGQTHDGTGVASESADVHRVGQTGH